MSDFKSAQAATPPTLGFSDSPSDEGDITRHGSREEKRDSITDGSVEDGPLNGVVSHKSRGVWEMEMLKGRMTFKLLVVLYGFFTVLSYTLSLSTCPVLLHAAPLIIKTSSLRASISTTPFQSRSKRTVSRPPLGPSPRYSRRCLSRLSPRLPMCAHTPPRKIKC